MSYVMSSVAQGIKEVFIQTLPISSQKIRGDRYFPLLETEALGRQRKRAGWRLVQSLSWNREGFGLCKLCWKEGATIWCPTALMGCGSPFLFQSIANTQGAPLSSDHAFPQEMDMRHLNINDILIKWSSKREKAKTSTAVRVRMIVSDK